jgi:hypothetical protein
MPATCTLGILSDIHYAGATEQTRGHDYEFRTVTNPVVRLLLRNYRHYVWLREPMGQNHLLQEFIERAKGLDYVIAIGDYSCDSGFCGLSDDAAFQSAQECLGQLRAAFDRRFHATIGDHELGKLSLIGGQGGMRLDSWRRSVTNLGLKPFWRFEIGRYVLAGVTSSLIALPVMANDILPEERKEWERLREQHLTEIRDLFRRLEKDQRVLLFCHDPTALPFLWNEPEIQSRASQIEQTLIGHLHSNLILWKSRLLAGMPRITFMGHSVQKFSNALNQAKHWRPFKVRLCRSTAGIELLKDGGYLTARLDLEGKAPAEFQFHALPRN